MTKRFRTIEELCTRVVSGGTPNRSNASYWVDGDIPWMKTGEIKKGYIHETEEHITRLGLDSSAAKLIPKNSVIVALYGDGYTAGTVAINKIPLTTNQACCNLIIDDEKAHYGFVYYYLKGSYANLVSLKSGGSQQNLNGLTVRAFPVLGLPRSTQAKIAAILTAYDDLIETNKRRIALLEKMAEELYREWFVRMRFPGWRDTRFVKGVPVGWEVSPIHSFANFKYGYTACAEEDDELPMFLRVTDINKSSYVNWASVPNCTIGDSEFDKLGLKPFDIVIARMADPGQVAIIEDSVKAVFASYLIKVEYTPTEVTPYYLFYTLRMDAFLEYFRGANSGATRGSINAGLIGKTKILKPDFLVQSNFDQLVLPIRKQLSQLLKCNQVLSQTRDLLLPRLISGKLSVEDLDVQFPPSMREEAA